MKFEGLMNLIIKQYKKGKNIVLFCIGTSKSTGDCSGPFLGSILEKQKLKNIKVIGTLENNVNAINIFDKYKLLKSDDYIIAVDSAFKRIDSFEKFEKYKEKINIRKKSIRPGAGVNKDLGEIGDTSIQIEIKMLSADFADIRISHYNLGDSYCRIQKVADFFTSLDNILNFINKGSDIKC